MSITVLKTQGILGTLNFRH